MRPRAAVLTALLVSTFCLANTPAQEPESATGFKTPQAVFDAAVKAEKKNDHKAIALLLTPKSQTKLVGELALFCKRLMVDDVDDDAGDERKAALAKLKKIMTKHGLTKDVMGKLKQTEDSKGLEANDKVIHAAVKDKPACVNDLVRWYDDLGGPGKWSWALPKDVSLKDVKIVGDKATGTLVRKGDDKDLEEPIEFAKIKGGWRLGLPEPKAKDKK